MRSKGGTISRCPIPALVGPAATRAVLGRFDVSLVRSRLHQGHLVTLLAWPRGSRSLPTSLVKGASCHDPRCLPSVDVGVPHLLAEGALLVEQKSRLTTDVDPMGFATLVRRDAALRAKKRQFMSCDDKKVSSSS